MSRVHDALRKAATDKPEPPKAPIAQPTPPPPMEPEPEAQAQTQPEQAPQHTPKAATALLDYGVAFPPKNTAGFPHTAHELEDLENIVRSCPSIPFTPAPDTLLIDPARPKEAPSEEFRSLRTRLNHLQGVQNLRTIVVTSASPGEGKTFTATNLAISQAQLAGKRILLADFDFRRPSIGKLFGIDGAPGLTDYLRGNARIGDILHHVADSNLYIITAGEIVTNPLELLNLPECNQLIEALRDHFDWVILDSPPLLFAADGNLLATMADGTILVVRIGTTTYDSISRAVQSLCENNVLGIVVNGAHHNELYSRYSYYNSYYYNTDEKPTLPPGNSVELEPAAKG
jgi:receptor protein-tyrosine kinase